jgi:hypothetical protein
MLRRMTVPPSMPPPKLRRRPPALRGRPLALTAIAAGLLCLAASQPAAASTHTDRAATSAYLHAELRYLQALDANATPALTSVRSLVAKVSGECPQVLTGAPAIPNGGRTTPAETKLIEQESAIRAEVLIALLRTWLSTDTQATKAFLAQTRTLRWSNKRLTRAVRKEAANAEVLFLVGVPDICSDARAWTASGYTRLAPGTTEAERALESNTGSQPSIEELLAPDETPSLRKLARSFARLKNRISHHLLIALSSGPELFSALGFTGEGTTGGKPIGEGHTAIGTSFTISAERETESESSSGKQCRLPIETQEGDIVMSGCIETGKIGVPEISCQQGRLPITMVTPASTASVSLLLSDGRLIVSPVIPIPTSLGGPLGYYRQIVRGPSPIPVSLTELDAGGKPLAVIKLRRLVECTKHPVKLVAGGPVAHGSVPHGPSYTITVGRYRYLGQIQKKLSITFGENGRGGSAGFGLIGSPRASFDYATSCSGRPATLIVAVLRSSKDTVFARTAGGLVALREAAIAPATKAGAKIAYEAFTEPPRELIVRNAAGQTILTRTIGRHFIGGCAHGGSGAVGNLG